MKSNRFKILEGVFVWKVELERELGSVVGIVGLL